MGKPQRTGGIWPKLYRGNKLDSEIDQTKDVGLIEETKVPDNTRNDLMRLDTNAVGLESDFEEHPAQNSESDNKGKFMFRYSDPILNKWDSFIIIIAIYNCFTLSFNIGFQPSFSNHPAYITFDVLMIF